MASDLVQLRWQYLRTTEALLVLENENLKLRNEIIDLKNAPPPVVTAVAAEDSVEKIKLRKHCHEMKAVTMRLSAQVLKIRMTAVQDLNALQHEKQLLEQSFSHLQKILKSKDTLTEGMISEKLQLTKQLNELRQQGSATSNSYLKDIARLKSDMNDLQVKLLEEQSVQSTLTNEIIALKSAAEQQHEALAAVRSDLEKSNASNERLKEAMQRKEMEGAQSVEEAYRQKQEMQEYYEKIIDQLGLENNYLRNTCTEQEAQIARLTNSLIGNKSHFAKYVEVKTENLSLQHKLENIEKNKKGTGRSSGAMAFGSNSHTHRLAAANAEQLSATLAAAAQSTSQGNSIVSMPKSEAKSIASNVSQDVSSQQTADMLPARQRRASRLANAGMSATTSSPSGVMSSQQSIHTTHSQEHIKGTSPQTSPRQQLSFNGLTQRQQLLQENINAANISMNVESTAQTIKKIKERTAAMAAVGSKAPKSLRFDDELAEDGVQSSYMQRHQEQIRTSVSATGGGSETAAINNGRIGSKVASFLDEKRLKRNSFGDAADNSSSKSYSIGQSAANSSRVSGSSLASLGGSKLSLGSRQSSSAKASSALNDKLKI